MEFVMNKLWVKDTNFYAVVLRKEAERRAERASLRTADHSSIDDASGQGSSGNPDREISFGELVKQQWEEKKRLSTLEKQ